MGNRSDYWKNCHDRAESEFPIGCTVMAILYTLRHEGIWEPQKCVVVRHTTVEQYKEGYRCDGVIVEYNGREYWTMMSDCKRIYEGAKE